MGAAASIGEQAFSAKTSGKHTKGLDLVISPAGTGATKFWSAIRNA
jgi:hypothetical protein